MAKGLQNGERIFVPVEKLQAKLQSPSSFVEREVLDVVKRSVRVDVGSGNTELIASSLCHRNIGILLIVIGDLETENILLDPLGKSILQFCRLLVSDEFIHMFKVRSLNEILQFWRTSHDVYSHIILVCHGNKATIKFANGGLVNVNEFMDVFNLPDATSKSFISLCCETGYKSFGGIASEVAVCERFIAPFQNLHGAIASQFVQTYLTYHLLEGITSKVAFKRAREGVPSSTSFRLWKGGQFIAGAKP